jgi:thiol-disulfide isomerase/thioredoxin
MVHGASLQRGILLSAVLLTALVPFAYNQTFATKARSTKPKESAPRFNATTTDGQKFSNASIKGKIVLLEFWTTWCSFCADEAPFVDKINREFGGKDFLILAVNVGESKKTVKNIWNCIREIAKSF